MLRRSARHCAPAARAADAAPFARALLMGRVSEAHIDAYFFDAARATERSAHLAKRDERKAVLQDVYGLTGGSSAASVGGMAPPASLRPFADASTAVEASAALSLMLEALVQHSKATMEFGKYLADTEATQQVLSRLAASIFALDAAAMAVDALPAGSAAGEADGALLAIVARRILERRVGEGVSLMNPSCVFVPDAAASMPNRFRAVQHVANGLKFASRSAADHPLASPAAFAAVIDAATTATESPEPNPAVSAVRGKRAFLEERAAREFPVNMYLKLPSIQLCDDVCAARKVFVAARKPLTTPTDDSHKTAVGTAANICAELFASAASLLRASSDVDGDEVAGYPSALKSQVYLEESRHARVADLALNKRCAGNMSVDPDVSSYVVTPPTELPAPKQAAKPAAAKKEEAAPKEE